MRALAHAAQDGDRAILKREVVAKLDAGLVAVRALFS